MKQKWIMDSVDGRFNGSGRKIIENILFGAASARKVFWPYSSGTQ